MWIGIYLLTETIDFQCGYFGFNLIPALIIENGCAIFMTLEFFFLVSKIDRLAVF